MHPATAAAFVDELLKIAEHKTFDDVKALEKTLRPGDILYTKPRKVDGLAMKAFYAIEKRIQGSPYTHVGLYVGDGKVVDAGAWKHPRTGEGATKVNLVPLSRVADRYSFKVLRVKTSPKRRQAAADYAKEQVGKDFNLKGMFRLVLPFKGRAEERDRLRKDLNESFFCSELVANSYEGQNLAKEKHFHHVMPGDIHRSPLTKTVAELK